MLPFIPVYLDFLVPTSTPVEVVLDAKKSQEIPFISQFKDISSTEWKNKSCGVASLAMIIDYYRPDSVEVNTLLRQAIARGAFLKNAGWIHRDLALLSEGYGLEGQAYDLSGQSSRVAYSQFKGLLEDGPVIASVHYKFDPKNPIPHLVVINRIEGDTVFVNDPAGKGKDEEVSLPDFLKAWKKRFIVIRPDEEKILSLAK